MRLNVQIKTLTNKVTMRHKSEVSQQKENEQQYLEHAIDCAFNTHPKYLMFWDKNGILEGGLWVLFKRSDECVLQVLSDPEFGDIMLCVDKTTSGVGGRLNRINGVSIPQNIIGFAIVVRQEPQKMEEYLGCYCSRIHYNLSKMPGYKRSVYEYILNKLEGCNLLCAKGLTMQRSGQIKNIV